MNEILVNKTGYYLTCEGYKPCYIKRYFKLYGDDYADINTFTKQTQVKKWKVVEGR